MAKRESQYITKSVSVSLAAQLATDGRPTGINQNNLAWASEQAEVLVSLGFDELGVMLFLNTKDGAMFYADSTVDEMYRAFSLTQLLGYLSQHYIGFAGEPTFEDSPGNRRRCTLLTTSGNVQAVEVNDVTALAMAFLSARAQNFVTPP